MARNIRASAAQSTPAEPLELGSFTVTIPTLRYGFALDTFTVVENQVKSGDILGNILQEQGLDHQSIMTLTESGKSVFDVKDFAIGKNYVILTKPGAQRASYLVYEPSVYGYFIFHLEDSLFIEKIDHPIDRHIRTTHGSVESSLWKAMADNGSSPELISKLEDALQWSVDFHHLQKGDEFKVVYEQHTIDGQEVGAGKVHAAYYKTGNNEYYAIYHDNGKHRGYYDLEGRPMKKGFLKAPLQYSRISSHFNLNRFHPILKRVRPHYGTDYAAPYGTPILAVGDGVVVEASYTNGNGNFVKIKHDQTYTTQYLHMQKFAKGIRRGSMVQQGQVIGYVGSTGLATGPHVCFRFWMNGKQVNHLNLSFPPPKPLPADELPAFFAKRDQWLALMHGEPGAGDDALLAEGDSEAISLTEPASAP
ncbi:MAG: peptidoglycan DD-metalloendopeptidase family protein [Lewinellaceae bacterium]|nr:peptidoglycan DD-metalloendopeptidase family protein [Lewinellaceae bacterium]